MSVVLPSFTRPLKGVTMYPPRASDCTDLTTEDDRTPIVAGLRLYNYYDCKWGVVGDDIDADGWFRLHHDDGTTAVLNGARVSTSEPRR